MMNEELKSELVKLIEAAKAAGEDAAGFIAAQAPDVVDQLIRWRLVEGIFSTVIGAVLIWAGLALFRLTHRTLSKAHPCSDLEIVWVPAGIAVLVLEIIGACQFYSGAMAAMKALTAPKLLLIEEIARLIG